jgi:hypothetical protein
MSKKEKNKDKDKPKNQEVQTQKGIIDKDRPTVPPRE